MGRMKYVKPLFRDLVDCGYKDFAREVYLEVKNFYNLVLVNSLNTTFGFE